MSGFFNSQAPPTGANQGQQPPIDQHVHNQTAIPSIQQQPIQQQAIPQQPIPQQPVQQQPVQQQPIQQQPSQQPVELPTSDALPHQPTNLPPPPSYPPPIHGEEQAPPLPIRPSGNPQLMYTPPATDNNVITCPRCSYHNHPSMHQCEVCEAELPPAMAPRPISTFPPPPGSVPSPSTHQFGSTPDTSGFAPPPRHQSQVWAGEDDPSSPGHYARDPHKLVAYIIPLPTPRLNSAPTDAVPKRFLIYTPPPPPLKKPTLAPGEKEEKLHMAQRKWQEEVRKAKNSTEKATSFKGIHHKMVRGTNKAMALTTSANLDFLGRASPSTSRSTTPERKHADDGVEAPNEPAKTVPVNEMLFLYPASMGTNEAALREEFINTLMRTKSKAQRDSVIATGLVPVGFAIDFMLIVVGGLGEIATVWAFKSIMGAKTARSISKRLASAEANQGQEGQLKLVFKPVDRRLEVLKDYLDAECNRSEPGMFPRQGQYHVPPTEGQVLDAIGWSPHQSGGETRNWEDEQWEMSEVKEDFKVTMRKGAKEWRKWCQGYEKDWEKGMRDQRSERNEVKYTNQ